MTYRAKALWGVLGLLAVVGIGGGLGFFSAGRLATGDAAGRQNHWREGGSGVPLAIRPVRQSLFELPAGGLDWLVDRAVIPTLPKHQGMSPSLCIHLMKLHGKTAQLRVIHGDQSSVVDLQSVLLDEELSRKHFGQPAFVKTRHGIRFPTVSGKMAAASDESHRDQCLATLGEWQVPASFRLVVEGETFSVADVLADSIANFSLDQDELEWTAMAYAFYVAPKRTWSNRYGRQFSFDDLADEMMERPLSEASCGGTHRYFSLTVLLRTDSHSPIFSDAVRTRVRGYLQKVIRRAVATQKPDGSWIYGWNDGLFDANDRDGASVRDSINNRLLVTGHLAEWMLYLPLEFEVPDEVRHRATRWLAMRVSQASADDVWRELCPYTHAVCAILDGRSSGLSAGGDVVHDNE